MPLYFYRDRDGKEIDLVIRHGDTLYPIEIKQTSMPRPRMIQNASLLEKAEGFKIGTKTIISMVEKPVYLAEDILAFPVTAL